jgi:uncharacterized membrane protein
MSARAGMSNAINEQRKAVRGITWRGTFFLLAGLLAVVYLSVFLNIPGVRQISSFLFLTFVPGFFILMALRQNHLGTVGKIVLSVGLSVAFILLGEALLNAILPALGYSRPLSTIPVLLFLTVSVVALAVNAYYRNRSAFFSFSAFYLTDREKAFLVLPLFFPLLSIWGTRLLNLSGHNVLLMALLLLIPGYIVFMAIFRRRIPERLYPAFVYLISISLVVMVALRSNHLIGSDVHDMFYVFQRTLQAGHWTVILRGLLDTSLSISILPATYQSLLHIDPEMLFRILYPLLFSFAPLIIYNIAKKYIDGFSSFLASFFFMAQFTFLWTTASITTNLAIFFFALSVVVLFQTELREFPKRLFFIIFAIACIFSHYSTSIILLFTLLLTWIGMKTLPRWLMRKRGNIPASDRSAAFRYLRNPAIEQIRTTRDTTSAVADTSKHPEPQFKKTISFSLLMLFFTFVFFWYGQVTAIVFRYSVSFIRDTIISLGNFFLIEARGPTITASLGSDITTAPQEVRVALSWVTVALIAIGVIGTLVMSRRMIMTGNSGRKGERFLTSRIDMEYFILALACCTLLLLAVIFPYITRGYSMERAYSQMLVVLAVFFMIGGAMIARWTRTPPAWLILIILIPFFMGTTGTLYQLFNRPTSLILNSAGVEYDRLYVHDGEAAGAQWLSEYKMNNVHVFPNDVNGAHVLVSQGGFRPYSEVDTPFSEEYQEYGNVNGYIFLRNTDIQVEHIEGEYHDLFIVKSKVYTSGSAMIYE